MSSGNAACADKSGRRLRPARTAAPSVAGGLGAQISLSKDENSCCATGPFISGTEHGALLCGASLPVPSTLYGLSVRRLISFDRWLPSHETSRFRSCFGLVLWAKLTPVMRASLTAFPYRGLSPHQFTPMSGAHHPTGANRSGWLQFGCRPRWLTPGEICAPIAPLDR